MSAAARERRVSVTRSTLHGARAIVLAGILGAVLPPPVDAQLAAPFELRVPKAPALATSDGRGILAYELHVTNLSPAAQTIRRIEILDDATPARVLLTLEDTALANALSRPGVAPPMAAIDRPRIEGGLRAIVFVWAPVSSTAPPTSVRHRLTFVMESGDKTLTQMAEGGSASVGREVVSIGPPLRGGPWLAANGPGPVSGHRRALIPVDGTPAIAQRFAIDYVMLDTAGRTFTGDRLKNESYYAEGVDALAVADGIVVVTKDSIPENVPGATSRAVPITLETIGGNHVILDLGQGRYAFYAHLQPGSLRVKAGDRVQRGQVLGLVGNSGNSTEPHLHFHISDSPSPLGSEGLPYTHEQFELVGRCKGGFIGCAAAPPETRRGELPSGTMILRFP
ncbi:MAG: M23 family metallopeptidase [Gemmatimonadaceae bacterium]